MQLTELPSLPWEVGSQAADFGVGSGMPPVLVVGPVYHFLQQLGVRASNTKHHPRSWFPLTLSSVLYTLESKHTPQSQKYMMSGGSLVSKNRELNRTETQSSRTLQSNERDIQVDHFNIT